MPKANILVDNIQSNPLYFPKKLLGIKPWSLQRKAIKMIMNLNGLYYNKTAIKSCHGIGKSYISAEVILQFLYTYKPSIVLSTAPTFRQVEKAIWKEVRGMYNDARLPLGGKLQDGAPNLQIVKDQWYAMGVATSDGDKFQGFHEENILVVVDEAAGVPESIYNSIEGLLTSQNARLLLIGNPTSVTGTFKKAFEEIGWNKLSVSAFDTPNFTYYGITEKDICSGDWERKISQKRADGKMPYPKLITPLWVADKYHRWGPSSMLYRTRVKGEFDEAGNDTLIPLSWIEAAQARYEDLNIDGSENCSLGCDVAEYGRDSSIVYIKKGRKVLPAYTYSKMPIMQLAGNIVQLFNKYQCNSVKVDTIGVGTGVEGRLDELGLPTFRVNVGEAPGGITEKEREKYLNKRAQLYWSLREQLDPENPYAIGLPDDDELVEELMATRYKISSAGKIQIIEKDKIKEAIGRSPDRADALMITCSPDDFLTSQKQMQSAGVW